jgi:hypothetical protein
MTFFSLRSFQEKPTWPDRRLLPSAAGLVLPVSVRAEHQGDDLLGFPGRLPQEVKGSKRKKPSILSSSIPPETGLMLMLLKSNTPFPVIYPPPFILLEGDFTFPRSTVYLPSVQFCNHCFGALTFSLLPGME